MLTLYSMFVVLYLGLLHVGRIYNDYIVHNYIDVLLVCLDCQGFKLPKGNTWSYAQRLVNISVTILHYQINFGYFFTNSYFTIVIL